MMQLWLNGKRIDDIAMLRAMLSMDDLERQSKLCSDLLDKIDRGIFLPWLERNRLNGINERQQDIVHAIKCFEKWCRDLPEEANMLDLSDKVMNALATICGIEASVFLSALGGKRKRPRAFIEKLQELLNGQEWYRSDADAQASIRHIAAEQIAIDSKSLEDVLKSVEKKGDAAVHDVYLVNVNEGRYFHLNELDSLQNLRFVGYGNPILMFPSGHYGTSIDMIKRKLKFERLLLNTQGVQLMGQAACCTDVRYLGRLNQEA